MLAARIDVQAVDLFRGLCAVMTDCKPFSEAQKCNCTIVHSFSLSEIEGPPVLSVHYTVRPWHSMDIARAETSIRYMSTASAAQRLTSLQHPLLAYFNMPLQYCLVLLAAQRLHNNEVHKADVLDNTVTKVIAKGLPNLDTVTDTQVWNLAGLDCTYTTQ